ncbi:hypothetical protein B0H12DRAFT_1127347 [Mycena haematopus]|nr:hypothetical protein B0H12DRAFT_1127347 [Mycena haematopus]
MYRQYDGRTDKVVCLVDFTVSAAAYVATANGQKKTRPQASKMLYHSCRSSSISYLPTHTRTKIVGVELRKTVRPYREQELYNGNDPVGPKLDEQSLERCQRAIGDWMPASAGWQWRQREQEHGSRWVLGINTRPLTVSCRPCRDAESPGLSTLLRKEKPELHQRGLNVYLCCL